MEINLTTKELRALEQYPGIAQQRTIVTDGKRKILHRDYRRKYAITSIILMFFIFAFIGWTWEVAIHVVQDGKFVNRGALHGPWLPIYGAGGIFGVLLLKKFADRPVLTFFLVVTVCSVVEYVTSWYFETYRHIQYWNYDGYFLNLNGRICLEGALIFGFAGCAGIYILAPFFDDQIKKIPHKTRVTLCVVIFTVFATDFVYSTKYPNKGEGITDYVFAPCVSVTADSDYPLFADMSVLDCKYLV